MAGRRPRRPGAVRRPPRSRLPGLAAEVQTEVRLLRATQAELTAHARERERCYRQVDPAALARSLPGLATIGGPALIATMGPAQRFANPAKFRSFTGLAPKASETGQTDRKGQPITKAGNRLLRTTLVRAADHARRQDPQLARIYWTQMVQRGKDHLGAICVVAAHLAERAWTVMDRGLPMSSATPTAPRSPPPRPRPSSPSAGPCPNRSAGGGAPRRGRPSTSPHRTCAWRSKRNEATLPLHGHSWPTTPPRQADPAATLTTKPP
jgi:Transposase IS116/IS110/IS902 family